MPVINETIYTNYDVVSATATVKYGTASVYNLTVNKITPRQLQLTSNGDDLNNNGENIFDITITYTDQLLNCTKTVKFTKQITYTSFREIDFHLREPYFKESVWQNTSGNNLKITEINTFNLNKANLRYKINSTNTNWNLQPILTESEFLLAVKPNNYWIQVSTLDNNFIDGNVSILYELENTTNLPTSTFTVALLGIDQDSSISFTDDKIQITNVTAPNFTNVFASIRTQSPSLSDWTSFSSDILTVSGRNSINATINALPSNQMYTLHLWGAYAGANVSGTITLDLTYNDVTLKRQKLAHVSTSVQPQYRTFNQKLQFDGINDNGTTTDAIADFMIDPTKPKTVSFVVDIPASIPDNYPIMELLKSNVALPSVTFQSIRFSSYIFKPMNIIAVGLVNVTRPGTTTARGYFYNLQGNYLGKKHHFLFTVDSGNLDWDVYHNGYKMTNRILWGNSTMINYAGTFRYNRIMRSFSQIDLASPDYFAQGGLADLIFAEVKLTALEARQLFDAVNNTDYSKYPASLMANRKAHYPLNSANASGTNVLDISGNSNTMAISGQSAPLNFISFY